MGAGLGPTMPPWTARDRHLPSVLSGDLISISMTVSDSDLSFTTCHMCEAKWWYRDG
jgi:hypothetical protein